MLQSLFTVAIYFTVTIYFTVALYSRYLFHSRSYFVYRNYICDGYADFVFTVRKIYFLFYLPYYLQSLLLLLIQFFYSPSLSLQSLPILQSLFTVAIYFTVTIYSHYLFHSRSYFVYHNYICDGYADFVFTVGQIQIVVSSIYYIFFFHSMYSLQSLLLLLF